MLKQVSKFDGKNADSLECPSKLYVSLSLYSKLIFEIVQGSEWPSNLDNDQVITCEGWDGANQIYITSATSPNPNQRSLSCGASNEVHKKTE